MFVARSQAKESLVEVGVTWWKEWRYVDHCLQMIYWQRQPDGQVTSRDGWRPWQDGATLRQAIREVIGDTSFFEAESLCPEHAKEVALLKAERAAAQARREAEQRLQAAQAALDEFKTTQNRLFSRRHGHKTGADYERAFARTKKRLQPEYDRLQQAVNEAKSHLEKLLANLAR